MTLPVENKSVPSRQVFVVYPGANQGAINPYNELSSIFVSGIFVPKRLSLTLSIAGTYTSGQGVDCEVQVEWLA